jgi:GntR family transcriptional regulator
MMSLNQFNQFKINKYSHIPIYCQLEEIIRKKIINKEIKSGENIPSENQLCRQHLISRMTVRRAIGDLIKEGLLYTERGKGTFVAKPIVKRDLSILTSIISDMRKAGYKVIVKVLDLKVVSASKEIANKLEITTKNKIIVIERLKLIENKPFFLEKSFLPYELCPNIINDNLNKYSIYSLIEDKYNLALDSGNISIEAIAANKYQSNLLQVNEGTPILNLEQTTYLKNKQVIEFMKAVAVTEKFKYYVYRKRKMW